MFATCRNVGTLSCDLCSGEGRAVQTGDSVEVCLKVFKGTLTYDFLNLDLSLNCPLAPNQCRVDILFQCLKIFFTLENGLLTDITLACSPRHRIHTHDLFNSFSLRKVMFDRLMNCCIFSTVCPLSKPPEPHAESSPPRCWTLMCSPKHMIVSLPITS
jgi:hypothetical protein